MIYRITYYFANLIIRVFYRKIFITGLENIPKDKPLLLVSNHPSGFLEPIIMACTFPIDLHFLVRGDLFEKKALRWLLISTNQIPIYRFKDGIAALRNNQKTIKKTIEILQQNKAVIIFAEGSTNADWYVRELKKGMARMAFQCIDGKPDLDLHILPIGVCFAKSEDPGTEAVLNIGKPISVKEYYSKNAAEAKVKMDELTHITHEKVKELTLHLEERNHEKVLRSKWKEISINEHDTFLPRISTTQSPFHKLKEIANGLNDGIAYNIGSKTRNKWLSYILAPLAFPGFLFWFIPVFSGFSLAKKFVKYREFVSSVRASASGGLCLIYLLILLPFLFYFLGAVKSIVFILFIFISGFIAVMIWEDYKLNG
jgi:1-acyl-sn-glycerol-3-phosphate acyltransferase